MQKSPKDLALSYNDEALNELYQANTLVRATKVYCYEKESDKQYYGIPENFVSEISEERSEFISLLDLISEKLRKINKLILFLENEITNL